MNLTDKQDVGADFGRRQFKPPRRIRRIGNSRMFTVLFVRYSMSSSVSVRDTPTRTTRPLPIDPVVRLPTWTAAFATR